jgi:hypothetical protein
MRPCQNAKSGENNSYVFNPADRPPADDPRHREGNPCLNVNSNQRGGGYETRSVKLGATSATAPRTLLYWQRKWRRGDSRDLTTRSIRRRTTIKSAVIDGYMVSGNMSLFNNNMNVTSKNKDDYLRNTVRSR